jgi:hypothetical protein
LRADDRGPLRSVLGRVDAELVGLDRKVRVVIDVDPVGMM